MTDDHQVTVTDRSTDDFPSWDATCACGKWRVVNTVSQEQALDLHEHHCQFEASVARKDKKRT